MIETLIHIIIGIAIGAYLVNSTIRQKTNEIVLRIGSGLVLLVQGLFNDKKSGTNRKTGQKIVQEKPKREVVNNLVSQSTIKGVYPCTCGGMLEPVSLKGFEGFYGCEKCHSIKTVGRK